MKNAIISLFLLILFTSNVLSQSKRDSSLYKNEIGINLIPAFKLLSSSSSANSFKNNIQYKRFLKKNLYARIGFSIISDRLRNFYSAPTISDDGSALLSVSYYGYKTKPETVYNLGLEYKWGKRKLQYFTGFDFGYSYSEQTYTEYSGKRDKGTTINTYSEYGEFGFHKNTDSIVHSRTNIKNSIVFSPFFGMQFHFTKHWFFSMQTGIQFKTVYGKYTNIVNSTYPIKPIKYTTFDFDGSGFINNFSLCYRF